MSKEKHVTGKRAYFLVLILLVSAIGLGVSRIYTSPVPETPSPSIGEKMTGKINTILTVRVYDSNGVLKQEVVKPDDLILTSFKDFLVSIFTPWNDAMGSDRTVVLDDTGDTGRTFTTYEKDTGSCSNTPADVSTGTGFKGGFVVIGSSSTAPTVSDYYMGTVVGSPTKVTSSAFASATGNVTISGSVSVSGSYTIREAGLGVAWIDSTGGERKILMFRDTFSDISVVASDSVAITYTIQLTSTEFTNNFGNMLAGIFTGCNDGVAYNISLYDQASGATDTVPIYNTAGASGFWSSISSGSVNSCEIGVGTTGGAVSRSDWKLALPVETMSPPNPSPYISGGDLKIRADISCASARTIAESALFMRITSSTSSYTYMMWRDTFTGVPISAGHAVRVLFTVDM